MTDITGKISTGIPGLDEILGGGLDEKNVYLVAGESGSGKTVLALQFIHDGLQKGENAVYVAVNEKPEDILEDAKSLGWDLEKYVTKKNLIVLDLVRFVNLGAPMSVRRMMADLEKHIRENQAKRLVIDSIDYLLLRSAESERDRVTYIRDLVLSVQGNLGCTTILTAPVPSGKTESGIVGMAERAVSGVFLLGTGQHPAGRTLTVRKMRKTGVQLQSYSCRIEKDRGIVVDTAQPAPKTRAVRVGEKIPEFSIEALLGGKTVTRTASGFRGKWLVLVFYPGDFTFVCPTELAELAENYSRFRELDAEILSISMDTLISHRTWAWASPKISAIPYPMGADPAATVTRLFGVYTDKGTTQRATFLVDPDGVLVAQEIHDDRIGRSTRETLRKLAAARHVADHPAAACPASWTPGDPDIALDTGE